MGTDGALWVSRLGALIDRGSAIIVATCDDSGRPGLTRGWGPTIVKQDEVLLAVTASPGTRGAGQLAPGALLSITFSEMTTYTTVQLLGTVVEITPMDDEAQSRVDLHLERFTEEAAKVGVARGATNLFLGDLVLVRLEVSQASDQTPGDHAGAALEIE